MKKGELVKEIYENLDPYYQKRIGFRGVEIIVSETFKTIMMATIQGERVDDHPFALDSCHHDRFERL